MVGSDFIQSVSLCIMRGLLILDDNYFYKHFSLEWFEFDEYCDIPKFSGEFLFWNRKEGKSQVFFENQTWIRKDKDQWANKLRTYKRSKAMK